MLLAFRGRSGLTQRALAAQAGVSLRAIQDWEAGVNVPAADRLRALIAALLHGGALQEGHERDESESMWAAALRESPRMHTSFDSTRFEALLGRTASAPATPSLGKTTPGERLERREDWGEMPDTTGFIGRADELALLRRWVLTEGSRLVAVLGMGGIGKTSLAARLARDVAPSFARVYWRSLRNAPPISEWQAGAIGFLSDQQLVLPSAESERLAALLRLLRERRCLLVLDNSEALFEPGQREGRYRAGMAGYGHLLQAVGEALHQSCLVLTSREAPPDWSTLGGETVRTLELGGLGIHESQDLLAHKQLSGDDAAWANLIARYGGNGLALKVVGESIRRAWVSLRRMLRQ